MDVIMMTNAGGYEDIACAKTHQSRVTGLAYDSLNNIVYSSGQDKVFRVGHGSSLALIVGVPHKEQILCMYRDTTNKRIFLGTKTGEVILYDITQGEKPKLLNTISNNYNGGIRCLQFDFSKNYLISGSFDDGELNLFDLDKPGREKLANCNATYKGKSKVRAIAWTGKRLEIIAGSADGSITFWDAVSGKSICNCVGIQMC